MMKRAVGLLLFIIPLIAVRISAQNSVPVASYPVVVGDPRPGLTVYASYVYTDVDGDTQGGTTFQWYRATDAGGGGMNQINLATAGSYKIKDGDFGFFIGFKVIPGAATGLTPGAEVTTPIFVAVATNDPPVAVISDITGSLNVNDVLTGHYTYSDYEGDLESGSVFQWDTASASNGTYAPISETSISHQITMDEQGVYFKFIVTPKAGTGTKTGSKDTSNYFGPANSKPKASAVHIAGTTSVNSTLRGRYTYSDADSDDEGSSLYQWYRGGSTISGANDTLYQLTVYDVDKMITFKVTPVAVTGYPDTGDPKTSNGVGPVSDPASTLPTAINVCISGTRGINEQLNGKYVFINPGYDEGSSYYIWYVGSPVPSNIVKEGTGNYHKKLTITDYDYLDKEIIFAVIPKNDRTPAQVGDTVFSSTLAIFDMPRYTFSVADSMQLLEAKPLLGTFWGTGVDNGYFYPARAGSDNNPYSLHYDWTFSDSITCIQHTSKDFTVTPNTLQFQGINSKYCDDHGPDTITVIHVTNTTIYNEFFITDPNAGLKQLSATKAVFFPDRMKAGKDDIISYRFNDGKTIIPIDQALLIDHIGTVTISNLDSGTLICKNIKPFELNTSPDNGTFSGPVIDGFLDPSGVTHYGDTTVTYTITSSLAGCKKSLIVPITIRPAPVISFEPVDYCIYDSSDSTRFYNTTLCVDSVKSWLWEFSEYGLTKSDTLKEPAFLYKTGGDHRIFLTATTINGCKAKDERTFDIALKPVADFTWKNECWHPNDSILFFDATSSTSEITSRSWNFFDGDSLHTIMNPRYPQKSTGYLPVEYIVYTGYSDCNDTIFRRVFIRPTKSLAIDYFEDFEAGNGGWVKDYESLNTWAFGTPNRTYINSAASGDSAWFTGYDISDQKIESSSIISPCFDFTTVNHPMIVMKLWKRFDNNRDGAALQYKVGDTGDWDYVGTLEDGINWYNSALIKGRPGGEQIGWTSKGSAETGWSDARHKLDVIKGKSDVKFRIAYGSDGTSLNNDGMAFDSIWIGERTRHVLLEHFTNTSNLKCSQATDLVNAIAEENQNDVINIQYHTNFPGSDPYYSDNPGDASARILFYGLTRAPFSFIDGGNDNDNFATLYDYYLSYIDSTNVIRRSLTNPLFDITLNPDATGGILSINGQIKALEDINAENLTLYLAVTEKVNDDHTGANGETEFYNVFRKFIPDAGGINLKKTWTENETLPIADQSWIIENINDLADIEVIAFLQNNITKEVYQAVSQIKPDVVVGIEKPISWKGQDFSLYPNPAVNKLTIAFRQPLTRETDVRIFNMQGAVVYSYKTGTDLNDFTIDNLNLQPGLYLVQISADGINLGFKKLVVSGK